MILGLGIDVIEIQRIREALDRHGDHFIRHVFRDDEHSEAPEGGRGTRFMPAAVSTGSDTVLTRSLSLSTVVSL